MAWRERRLESLPPPISGPARAYAQFPSEHEAAWTSGDLTGGYGASTAPAEGGRQYAHGFVDARFPNQIMLPPAVAVAPTSADGLVRDHFELAGVLYALIGSAVYQSTDGARWTLAHQLRRRRHAHFGGSLPGRGGGASRVHCGRRRAR